MGVRGRVRGVRTNINNRNKICNVIYGTKCYGEKQNQKQGLGVPPKGIQLREIMESLVELITSEQRYLVLTT